MNTSNPSSSGRGTGATPACVIAIVALLTLGALIRLVNLNDFPAQVHNDESSSIVDGIMHFMPEGRGGWALFGSCFGGHPSLSYWLNALPSRVIGEVSLWSARLGAALGGIVSLILLAIFVFRAYGPRVAIFFLVFIVPYPFHAHFSRTAFPYIHALVGMGLVSYVFTRFLQAPSIKTASLTGVAMGLAALCYPATHVLPASIAGAVVIRVWPDLMRKYGAARGSGRVLTMALCFILGILVTLTPHIIYSYKWGYSSRLTHTFVLHEHNIKHLGPQTGDPNVTPAGIVWFNMTRTAKIFYSGDTAEQFQFYINPFPWWGAALAAFGALVLIGKALRRDAVSIYLALAGLGSFIASGLMVEGNFSPHLILFAVITPLSMALGWDKLLSWFRLRDVVVAAILTIAFGVLWADWNWQFYNQVVSTERSRLTRAVTYLLRLPIDTKRVTTILGAAGIEIYPNESYYRVIYPKSTQAQVSKDASVGQITELVVKGNGPAVVLENQEQAEPLKVEFEKLGKKVQIYRPPEFSGVFVYVE